ncbi:hypothetical protein [Hyphomicrobium sp. 99]|uniref:hypothetical protein n=1 Tax=Hyphomicrobium sp. 99 TaxID=1163419 RepID=UPI0005F82F5D|nr:hypothetical protein [Hyphomicrobium sp. 99]
MDHAIAISRATYIGANILTVAIVLLAFFLLPDGAAPPQDNFFPEKMRRPCGLLTSIVQFNVVLTVVAGALWLLLVLAEEIHRSLQNVG